jgi:hypothetical protein
VDLCWSSRAAYVVRSSFVANCPSVVRLEPFCVSWNLFLWLVFVLISHDFLGPRLVHLEIQKVFKISRHIESCGILMKH